MSHSHACSCTGKDKRKKWVVTGRRCNYSYFETPKGGWHHSDYSQLRCKECGGLWRTKAKYVDDIPDDTDPQWVDEQSEE